MLKSHIHLIQLIGSVISMIGFHITAELMADSFWLRESQSRLITVSHRRKSLFNRISPCSVLKEDKQEKHLFEYLSRFRSIEKDLFGFLPLS